MAKQNLIHKKENAGRRTGKQGHQVRNKRVRGESESLASLLAYILFASAKTFIGVIFIPFYNKDHLPKKRKKTGKKS